MKRKIENILFLFLIVIVGIYLRQRQWNDYLIYPDSYRYLLTNSSILICGKPFFCALINLLSLLPGDLRFWARALSLLASIISIPLVYLFLNRQKQNGLLGAALLALSFVVVSWSSFIVPDFLAISFFLLFLLSYKNYFGPVMLLLTCLIRPEYFLLFIPAALFLAKDKITRFFYGSFFIVASAAAMYFNKDQLQLFHFPFKFLPPITLVNLLMFDFAISLFALLGIVLVFAQKKWNRITNFFLFQIVIFAFIYFLINPLNWRYAVNLVIPLIYFASFFCNFLFNKYKYKIKAKNFYLPTALAVLFLQFLVTFVGIKANIPDTNYESLVVKKSQDLAIIAGLDPQRLATSFPEAAKLETGKEAIDPINGELRKNDLLIFDPVLQNKGFSVGDNLYQVGKFDVNAIYYRGAKKYFGGSVVVYIVK